MLDGTTTSGSNAFASNKPNPMTNEEKALAKEQAKQWITKAPEPELVAKPRAHKGKPRSAKSHHVGSFPTVAEAVRRLAQWLDRQQALERANAAKTTTP